MLLLSATFIVDALLVLLLVAAPPGRTVTDRFLVAATGLLLLVGLSRSSEMALSAWLPRKVVSNLADALRWLLLTPGGMKVVVEVLPFLSTPPPELPGGVSILLRVDFLLGMASGGLTGAEGAVSTFMRDVFLR